MITGRSSLSTIQFDEHQIDVPASESVLDALLRSGFDVPYSCKSGVCQTCLMRAKSGSIPKAAQSGLKDTLVAQGYFMACSCKPETDMLITLPDEAALYVQATIHSKELLSKDILQLTLRTFTSMPYRAGQFINVHRHDGLSRSYSLANLPQADHLLELHIKRMENGAMSNWLFDQTEPGQQIDIQGPIGNCFYSMPENRQRNILLIGTGTGLAPLIGIVHDALTNGHSGDIHLYHGSRNADGLYKHAELCELEARHENVHYYPCCSREDIASLCGHQVFTGRANNIALGHHKKLNDWMVYLCGIANMVNTTRKQAFLAGARIADIYADPFSLKELRKKPR